jgi:predicted transposase YdaD
MIIQFSRLTAYLRLNKLEKEKFQTEIGTLIKEEKEEVMQIVTSWMEEGIERGIEREKNLILRLINRKFGQINLELETEIRSLNIEIIETLGEAIFDLDTVEDLQTWLDNL